MCLICLLQWNLGNSSSEGKREAVRVIGVNFSAILIKGNEISLELAENSSYPSSSYRGSSRLRSSLPFVPRALSMFFSPQAPKTRWPLRRREKLNCNSRLRFQPKWGYLLSDSHRSRAHVTLASVGRYIKWNPSPPPPPHFISYVICGFKSGQIYAPAAPF